MKQEIINELWKLESINRHQENYKGMIPITAVIKVLDKYFDTLVENHEGEGK